MFRKIKIVSIKKKKKRNWFINEKWDFFFLLTDQKIKVGRRGIVFILSEFIAV